MPASLTDWSLLVTLAGSPTAMLALTFFVWKQGKDQQETKRALEELRKALYENGFVRKETFIEVKHNLETTDQRLDLELNLVRKRTHEMANLLHAHTRGQ